MTLRAKLLAPIAVAAGLLAGAALAETAEQKGTRIAQAASDVERGYRDVSVTGEMILRSKGGSTSERRFDAAWLSQGAGKGSRSLLIFRWPGDIRNTALLTHANTGRKKDDQWLYLPELVKVRRISGSGRSGSFVGSEFAFEDMVDQDVEKYDHVWVQDANCPGGGKCHVIDRFPKSSSGYSRQRIWIDQAELRLQQVKYFDRRGAHMKTLQIKGYKKYNNRFWRASRMDMTNHQTGKSTSLTWNNYKFDTGLNPNQFTTGALKRIR